MVTSQSETRFYILENEVFIDCYDSIFPTYDNIIKVNTLMVLKNPKRGHICPHLNTKMDIYVRVIDSKIPFLLKWQITIS